MITAEFIESLLVQHNALTVFIGSFFFGESVIITAAYLASHYGWPFIKIFTAAFAGTVVADIAWYFAGRYLHSTRFITRMEEKRKETARVIDQVIGKRPFVALLFVKFLYGSRTLMILYLAARKVSLPLFIVFDAIGTVIWLAVIIPLGYAAARGASGAQSAFDVLQVALAVLVISALVFRGISIWLSKKIERKT